MKINEKNLCMFATTPPVDLEGWLNKRGELNKSWQRRWFVLKGNLLFYFEKRSDKEPLGMIILEGCTVELAEEGEQYCFQIIFHGPNNRTYYLSTESQSNMEQWMKALTCAGYDYMKLMVAELQRQLDEIEGQCKEKTPDSTPVHVPPKAPPRRQNPFNKPLATEYVSNADVSSSTDRNAISHTGNGAPTPVPLRTGRKAPAPPAPPPEEVHSTLATKCAPVAAAAAVANGAPSEPKIPTASPGSLEDVTRKVPGDATGAALDGANPRPTAANSRRAIVAATKSSDAIASMVVERDRGPTVASLSADQVDGIGERRPMERGAIASFSFETMHSALGIPVLADLSNWNAGRLAGQSRQQHQQEQSREATTSVTLSTETL